MAASTLWTTTDFSSHPLRLFFLCLNLFISSSLVSVFGVRVENQIYLKLHNNSQCFRIMNGTHQIGCQSSRFGDTGVVHMVKEEGDIDWIEEDKGNHAPFIAVLDMNTWSNHSSVKRLRELEGKVAGLIVIFEEDRDLQGGGYSPDYSCPNPESGYNSEESCKNEWNKYGDARWFQDWPFPIILLEDPKEIQSITQCFESYNKPVDGVPASYPLCSATLWLWMHAAKDTPTCLRRGTLFNGIETGQPGNAICTPLGGYNMFVLIPSTERANESTKAEPGSTMVLASRMDSFTMFSDVSPGVESASSSLIAVLAVAEALGRDSNLYQDLKNTGKKNKKHLLLALFNGESLDYVGSSRFVFNMRQGVFPHQIDEDSEESYPHLMNEEDLGFFVEVNQLGLASHNSFTAYVDSAIYKENGTQIDAQLKSLNKNFKMSGNISLSNKEVLPSSSYQRLLRSGTSLPGLVVTDFPNQEFRARYYNSFADRKPQFTESPVPKIAAVAEAVLGAAVSWIDPSLASRFNISHSFIEEVYNCFVAQDLNGCQLFERAVDGTPDDFKKELFKHPLSRTYIGPEPYFGSVHWTAYYLMYALFSIRTNISSEECSGSKQKDWIHSYRWLKPLPGEGNESFCARSDSFSNEAKSPAFIIKDYDWESGNYSTWTESRWSETDKKPEDSPLKVFLIPDPRWEWTVFSLGLVVLIFSFVSVYFLHKRAQLLFGPSPADV